MLTLRGGRFAEKIKEIEVTPMLVCGSQSLLQAAFQAAGRAGKPACRQDCLPHELTSNASTSGVPPPAFAFPSQRSR